MSSLLTQTCLRNPAALCWFKNSFCQLFPCERDENSKRFPSWIRKIRNVEKETNEPFGVAAFGGHHERLPLAFSFLKWLSPMERVETTPKRENSSPLLFRIQSKGGWNSIRRAFHPFNPRKDAIFLFFLLLAMLCFSILTILKCPRNFSIPSYLTVMVFQSRNLIRTSLHLPPQKITLSALIFTFRHYWFY